jgi:hypothetical protein
VLALLAAMIGGITLLEYVLGWNAGIDELLARDSAQAFNPYPGRMSPYTAAAYLTLGAGLTLPGHARWRGFLTATAMLAGAVGVISLMGYAMGARELTTDELLPPVALNTAAGLCLVSTAALLMDPLFDQYWPARAADQAGDGVRRRAADAVCQRCVRVPHAAAHHGVQCTAVEGRGDPRQPAHPRHDAGRSRERPA